MINDQPRILLVDDDEGARRTLTLILRQKGFQIETAATGQEALEKARARAFDLAFLDMRLPDTDGVNLIAPLRALSAYMGLIMITGYASVGSAVQALKAGASGYVTKPVDIEELLAVARKALEKQRLAKEARRAEEALRRSESRMRSLFGAAPIGIGILSERVFMELNDRFCELIGYAREELVGKSARVVYPTDEEFERVGWEKYAEIAAKGIGSVETRFQCKDGKIIDVLLSSAPLDPADLAAGITFTVLDITERKRVEMALLESEQRYRALFDRSHDGVFILDLAGVHLDVNERGAELLGYTREELIGKTTRDVVIPAEYPDSLNRLDALMAGPVLPVYERTFRTKEGAPVPVEVNLTLISDSEGRALHAQSIVRDITERKRNEADLQQRARQLQLLHDIGSPVTALLDLDEVLDRTAHLVKERFGYHQVSLFLRLDGEDKLVLKAGASEFTSTFAESFEVDLGVGMIGWAGLHGESLLANDVAAEPRYVNAYPDLIFTRSALSVPIQIGGEIVGVLDLQSRDLNAFSPGDVTTLEILASQVAVAINNAQLFTEAARRSRELALLNRVITASTVTVPEIGPILGIICREMALAFQTPQASAALYNAEKTESVIVAEYLAAGQLSIMGMAIPVAGNFSSQHLLTKKTPLVIEDVQTDPRSAALRDLHRRRGGVSQLLIPLIANGEVMGSLGLNTVTPRHFSAEDITLARNVADQVSTVLDLIQLQAKHKMVQAQFHQAQKMEAVGRLAGGVAHDFNNLLTVIQLSARLLERKLPAEDPLASHVQRIGDACKRAANLTRQLLAFSRREVIEPQVINLNQVLGELDKMLRRLIGENYELTLILAHEVWPIKFDITQMEQIVVNLAVNARDAMPIGGELTIETANVVVDLAHAAEHCDLAPGEYVRLTVTDTGTGMSDEIKEHIFEPFFTTKPSSQGTGLGLATVYGIVTQNQGHITVHSVPGEGTTFQIYLARASTGASKPAAREPMETVSDEHCNETLLLVEDERNVLELAQDILTGLGYRVLTAGDGVEAIQIAEAHPGPIHMLITDVIMPRMGGRALADRLKARDPALPVLFVSGYTDDVIVHHNVLRADAGFLAKPFEAEALAQKVRAALDAKTTRVAASGT